MPRKPKNVEVAAASLIETTPDVAAAPPPAPVKKAKTGKAKPAPEELVAKAPRTARAKKTASSPTPSAELVSTEPTTEQVAHEAYLLWLGEGQPEGKDMEHWLVAEQIVRSRLSLLAAAVHTA